MSDQYELESLRGDVARLERALWEANTEVVCLRDRMQRLEETVISLEETVNCLVGQK